MQASSIEMKNILKNLIFPLTKKDLIQQAKKHGASCKIIEVLENLPDKEYDSSYSVIEECKGNDSGHGDKLLNIMRQVSDSFLSTAVLYRSLECQH